MDEIRNAFNNMFQEEIINIENTLGRQNEVYLITTINNKYIIKKFIVLDEQSIEERKEQLRISKIWNDNHIPCIQPLTDIYKFNNNYYIIYPFIEGSNLDEGDLSLDQIKQLAKLQAKIHLLEIDTWLPSHIKHIDYKNPKINYLIDKCNEGVDIALDKLIVCNNDFKPLNIIWHNDNPYIIDFDAVYKNHPTFSLVESAYTFCHKDNELNLDYYKEYINEYKKEYKRDLEDIDLAIYTSWNGKLQWINYLEDNKPEDEEINSLINQMIKYQEYVDAIRQILI